MMNDVVLFILVAKSGFVYLYRSLFLVNPLIRMMNDLYKGRSGLKTPTSVFSACYLCNIKNKQINSAVDSCEGVLTDK